MSFLLIHSPLVPRYTMSPLANELSALGHKVVQPQLTGLSNAEHIQELATILKNSEIPQVCIAHSGGGSYLPALESSFIEAYILVDAIFPTQTASRFDYFDSTEAVEAWKAIAESSDGCIPVSYISKFGAQISNAHHRKLFNEQLRDVDINLYEEQIPCCNSWPSSIPGIYFQWTPAYEADANRARTSGFVVRKQLSNHFELMNNPSKLARECIEWRHITCS